MTEGTDMSANPYVQGWREWDERYADLVLGKRNWQIAAGCSLLVSLILAVGIVWLALRSHYWPGPGLDPVSADGVGLQKSVSPNGCDEGCRSSR
jgi:type IV secretory pathway TrbF-like protein